MSSITEPWDRRYRSGHYAFLTDLGEAPRYGVIAAYLAREATAGRILDAGCGEAILARHLPAGVIREYVGLDCARVALDRVARVGVPMRLICADLDRYSPAPGEWFDALVFNEVLYNLTAPIDTVERCARHLAPAGIVIISMYMHNRPGEEPIAARVQEIWRGLERSHQWRVLDATTVQNISRNLLWRVQVLRRPSPSTEE